MVQKGVSQRDIKLAIHAVDNHAHAQAEASDSSMTGMAFYAPLYPHNYNVLFTRFILDPLDYSTSESSFSAFSGASGEVVRLPYPFSSRLIDL